jgi:hypothetical protein
VIYAFRVVSMVPRASVRALVVLLVSAAACSRDPQSAHARQLERVASWSASVQFTNEMARARYVPRAYVHDVLATAARDLASIRSQIQNDTDIDAASRTEHAAWCARLTELVETADRERALPDDRPLRDLEARVRAAAQAARSAGARETPR